ncbi:hypothetical protein EJB05_09476, partial [Eragrostis curvula]
MAQALYQIAPWQHALRQEQLYLILYLDQVYAGTRQNQSIVVHPELANCFGIIAVNDWPIYDGPNPNRANMVARARGHHVQTGTFEKERDKGEWAIIGGTGKFTFAQGAIYYDVMKKTEGSAEIKELHIGVLYTPMDRSALGLMFTEYNPSEVDAATKTGTEIGGGSYGTVYKAKIRNKTVAVKTNGFGWQGEREFNEEVNILRHTRHENLVTSIGACTKKRALFYEFCPNGTLFARLNRLDEEPFSWEERIRVANDICSALMFLHNAKPPIAHGDLKPSNILFDAKGVCKLGDFGISRKLNNTSDTTTPSHTTDLAKGSGKYMDPEFSRTRVLTPYSDVYALGIILIQLVTGKDNPSELREDVSGVLGKFEKLSEDMQTEAICEELVDGRLMLDDRSKRNAVRIIRLGLKCSNASRKERPKVATEVHIILESMKRGPAVLS